MKNKRYKRLAKRIAGTCFTQKFCDKCKYKKICWGVIPNGLAFWVHIRKLEKDLKK